MSRVSVANHAKLSWLLIRGAMRRLAGRVNGHPFLRWPVRLPLKADRLLIAPQDLRTADATRASEIYAGRFAFAGKVVVGDGRSIFEMEPPSPTTGRRRCSASAGCAICARRIPASPAPMPARWSTNGSRCKAPGMRWPGVPDVLSRRIISWLSQSTLILQDADMRFYRRFLRSLVRQVRYLRHTAGDAHRGVARMQAAIALAYAALCIAGQARHIKSATEHLQREIEQQILPDGGHISRDPGAIIEILLEFLPLRQAFTARNIAPPQALSNAIDRMMPMLRFFRHSEGTFAHFNGMGATPADLILTLLAYDETRGAPLSNAPYSAYQRLEANGGVVIMDTGRAPPIEMSLDAHAGCLSFEFSTPKQSLIVVNCGMPSTGRENWRQLARSTAAHSTVTFNDTSSARFVELAMFRRVLGGSPMLGGPRTVSVTREDAPDAIALRAAHDGYADRFGIMHERMLMLAADGTRIDGEDIFLAADGGTQMRARRRINSPSAFTCIPTVKATRLTDGHGVMLMTPNKEVWTFTAHEDRVELEDSVYLAGSEGPRRTTQIVIHGHARTASRVQWSLQHANASGAPRRAASARRRSRGCRYRRHSGARAQRGARNP